MSWLRETPGPRGPRRPARRVRGAGRTARRRGADRRRRPRAPRYDGLQPPGLGMRPTGGRWPCTRTSTRTRGRIGPRQRAREPRACDRFRRVLATTLCCALAPTATPSANEAYTFAVSLARAGRAARGVRRRAPRPTSAWPRASGPSGCRVGYDRFTCPGKGRSRNVIGIRDSPADCLVIAMAHADTRAAVRRGARQRLRGRDPRGAGTIPRDGAGARVRRVARRHRRGGAPVHEAHPTISGRPRSSTGSSAPTGSRTSRLALSLDEVGRGSRLRSAQHRPATTQGRRAAASSPPATGACSAFGIRPARATPTTVSSRGPGRPPRSSACRASRAGTRRATRRTACTSGPFTRVLRIVWPLLRTWRT